MRFSWTKAVRRPSLSSAAWNFFPVMTKNTRLETISTGTKQHTSRESSPFKENIMARDTTMSSTVRTTSISWSLTKLRMSSTSWVQRWMMSPVWWELCQA